MLFIFHKKPLILSTDKNGPILTLPILTRIQEKKQLLKLENSVIFHLACYYLLGYAQKMKICLIAAMDQNRLIGSQNRLPWHLPADLQYFKKLTLNQIVIMGRKTYESMGKALPQRQNIVLSRNPDFTLPDAICVPSLHHALELVQNDKIIFIIGGASLFEEGLHCAADLYLTQIEGVFEGDTYFPPIDPQIWRLISEEHHLADEKNPYNYNFLHFQK